MNTPIIYIAGPVSGQPNLNRDAFEEADRMLKSKGFITRNPHAFCGDIQSEDPQDPKFYRRGFEVLCRECTDLLLLDGWQYSQGATQELNVAKICQIRIHTSISDLIKFYTNDEEA